MNEAIDKMLTASVYAVVGASTNPEKYGHKVYKMLKEYGKIVFPVNPRAKNIDGDTCYDSITDLPHLPDVVVSVVPPALTEKLVDEMIGLGIQNLWIQPGAESELSVKNAKAGGIMVVHGGACIMVGLRTHAKKA